MPLTTINDTALHEAGHALIAYLNDDFFNLQYVTVDERFSRIHDSNSIGGIKGYLTKEPSKLSLIEHDKLCVCALAGLAADDINHNNGNLSDDFYNNSIWAQKMNSNKYSGDDGIFRNHLVALNNNLRVPQRTYTKSCQELLYNLFTEDEILPILINLRNLINNANSKSIEGHVIKDFLEGTYLKSWKESNWEQIFINRQTQFYKNTFLNRLKSWLKTSPLIS